MGLPGWFSGQESACQCRGPGFDPRSGKIPRAVQELSLGAKSTQALMPECLSSAPRPCCSLRQRETGAAVRPRHGQTEWTSSREQTNSTVKLKQNKTSSRLPGVRRWD